jgi:hypothetical protein
MMRIIVLFFCLITFSVVGQKVFPKGSFSKPVIYKITLVDDGRLYDQQGLTFFANDAWLHRGKLPSPIVDSIKTYVKQSAERLTGSQNVYVMPYTSGALFRYPLPNYSFNKARYGQSGDVYLKYAIRLEAIEFKTMGYVSYRPKLKIRVVAKTPAKKTIFRKTYRSFARKVRGVNLTFGDFSVEKTNGLKPDEILRLFKTGFDQIQ